MENTGVESIKNTGIESKLLQAQKLISFIDNSPSCYHVVKEVSKILEQSGFLRISEGNLFKDYKFSPKGKYFFTRNDSSIIAFAVGGKYSSTTSSFLIATAHTDFPSFVVKPKPLVIRHGSAQLAAELYGGPKVHSWLDRDLKIAGRVIVKTSNETDDDIYDDCKNNETYKTMLVHIKKPYFRIPSAAIHFTRSDEFTANRETHMIPVACTSTAVSNDIAKFEQILHGLIAGELGIPPDSITQLDLHLSDNNGGAIGGINEEFVFSPRLDNLGGVFTSLQGYLESIQNDHEEFFLNDSNIRMIAFFDNEEIGSMSAQGAKSVYLDSVIRRITASLGESMNIKISEDTLSISRASSFCISVDADHALHPNFSEYHDLNHRPVVNRGVIIKHSAAQNVASSAPNAFIIEEIAKRNNIPVQHNTERNDLSSGRTLGPIIASQCGLRVIDIGMPQLSMHSIRETAGVKDVVNSISLIKAYFSQFSEIDQNFKVDL